MKKEDFLKLGLTEEQATKAEKASEEELNGYVPKATYDEVKTAKKQLEKDIASRDEQSETLKKVDASALEAEIVKLQDENKTNKENYEKDLLRVKTDAAVEKAIVGASARNIMSVKALLKLEDALLEGDVVKGLDEQLKALKTAEDTKFLFLDESKTQQSNFKGIKPSEKRDGVPGAGTQPASLSDAVKAHLTGSN